MIYDVNSLYNLSLDNLLAPSFQNTKVNLSPTKLTGKQKKSQLTKQILFPIIGCSKGR